jgi:lipopolysaccharide transport system ATP-binding protein
MIEANPDDVLVRVENVSKKFCRSLKKSLWYGVSDVASALNPFGDRRPQIAGPGSDSSVNAFSSDPQSTIYNPQSSLTLPPLRPDEFWAVQNVSFELRRGECLGLIGHNGAGKSTLLKVLNGLIPPDTGRITMKGRVAALIELNAGFNPILSGRENIFNQAALLGFSKEETLAKFDEIVEFAEIGDFLDMPVQNYSSGMRVRLGFAVAAQMEPDVLIIDEVLAVGDVGFRYKCLNRMAEMLKTSAFVFVSHAMPQVARICTSVLHMDHGSTLLQTTNMKEGLESYYNLFDQGESAETGTGMVRVTKAKLLGPLVSDGGIETAVIEYLGSIELEMECEFGTQCDSATIQLVIWNQELIGVIDVLSYGDNGGLCLFPIQPFGPSRTTKVHAKLDNLQLNSGRYTVSIHVLGPDGNTMHCKMDRAVEFTVRSNSYSACNLTMQAAWKVIGS